MLLHLPRFYALVSLWTTVSAITASANEEGDSPEEIVCQSKFFRAKCLSEDEVIQVQRARYGRMNLSKCVRENFGYIGCSNNVLDILDSHCSGRHSCSLRVLDENFFNMKPCHEDLKSYLAVEYRCIEVINPRSYSCQEKKPANITLSRGNLASVVSTESGCGTAHAPWHIRVLPGQRVNVTLLDFSWVSSVRTPVAGPPSVPAVQEGRHCKMYALLREPDQSTGVTVCGGGQGRVKAVYVSRSEHLEVVMVTGKNPAKNAPAFVLAYEAVGCPDMEAPPGGWVQRNEDVAILGCAHSAELWHLYCRESVWIGQFRNCTPETFKDVDQEVLGMNLSLPYGLVAIILLTMAFSFGLVILVVGVVCLARLQHRFAYNSIDDVRCPSEDKRDQSRSPMATVVTMTTVGGDDVGSSKQPKTTGWSWARSHSLRRQSTYVTCAYPDCEGDSFAGAGSLDKTLVAPLVAAGVEPSPLEAWRCLCERCTTNQENLSNQQQQNVQQQQQQLHHHLSHHRQELSHHHHLPDENHPQQHSDQQPKWSGGRSHKPSGHHPSASCSLVRFIQPNRGSSRSDCHASTTPIEGSGDHRRSSSSSYDRKKDRSLYCSPGEAGTRGNTNTW